MALRAFWGNYWRVANTLGRLRNKVFYKPLYYHYWSMDCDCCEREYCDIYEAGRHNFAKWCETMAEGADGPVHIEIITKAEYEQWYEETQGRAYTRDHIMEAFENGYGTSVLIP